MCGIAGVVRYGRSPDEAAARAMMRALRHRGPDGEGVAVARSVALAHTRLALIDAAHGAQPMASPDRRFWLTYNGEVYDHIELRAELRERWDFRTRTDAEVVLAACATWGWRDAARRFNGMFAFFLWDDLRQEGVLVRDRLGVKPAVWARVDGGVAFASEAKALLAAGLVAPRAHAPSLVEYLVAPCFSGVEHGMFEDVEHVPAGGALVVRADGHEIESWWRFAFAPEEREDHVVRVRERLPEAARLATRADVPVAGLLSGGLDSTALCALARPDATFSVRFDDQARFDYAASGIVISDDGPYVELAARSLGLRNVDVFVSRSTLREDLRALAATDDALPAWEQEVAQRHLARAVARTHKAVLVGDAADETHWGYHFLLDDEATRTPSTILSRLGAVPLATEPVAVARARLVAHYEDLASAAGHPWDRDPLLATGWLVVARWLARLLHNGDVHTMAFGLEARVPFADVPLVELARRVPPPAALANGEKAVLRAALRGLIPEPIRTRRKSALPKDQGSAEVLRAAARDAVECSSFVRTWIDASAVRSLTDGRPLQERDRAALFRVACLGEWADLYGAR